MGWQSKVWERCRDIPRALAEKLRRVPLTKTSELATVLNRMVQYAAPQDVISTTFAALADPTRRSILARLAEGEASVSELAEPFDMSLPAVSKHLRVLERAGLISRGRNAQWRPCRLRAEPLKDAAEWIEVYRRFWEESFRRLDGVLENLKAQEKKDNRE